MGILKRWFKVFISCVNSKNKAIPFNSTAPWTTHTLENVKKAIQENAEFPIHLIFQFIKVTHSLLILFRHYR